MEAIEQKNYYEILGVEQDASLEQIREAYRDIARMFHPDSHFFDEITQVQIDQKHERMFQLVTLAYDTLVNPSKRTAYDKQLGPQLAGWEIPEEEDTKVEVHVRPKIRRQRKPTGGNAWGRFGVVFDEYESALVREPQRGAVSVAKMIQNQRKDNRSWFAVAGLISAVIAVLSVILVALLRG